MKNQPRKEKRKKYPISKTNNYKNGKLHGRCQGWYKNGNKDYDQNFKNGKRHGRCQWWYDNGQKRYDDNYKDGKLILGCAK